MSAFPRKEMRRAFSMPFGAGIIQDDGVLFRLWAPEAEQVDLCLMAAGVEAREMVPMAGSKNGWFVLHHHTAKTGDLYQFRIDNDIRVPDPASRSQAQDLHGPSVVCNPLEFCWHDRDWQGRPWEEAVIYELHVGAFSPNGDFNGVTERLDYLADLGITAIELMPVAQFPGRFNWGYDGSLLFAPCNRYGKPEDLKNLVEAAHRKGLMVFLDVVYNHFGPEGNYLSVYARDAFFTERIHTPWGAAINFSGRQSRVVRDFYIANALYWLVEYHFDGLRLDAVHTIFDQSRPDILEEIAERVREGPGLRRQIHLILENDNNRARYLARNPGGSPRFYTAQCNDDLHHACHTLLTGETEGYYTDYADEPMRYLGRCLTEGFGYQGEYSRYRGGKKRGEPSVHLPPTAFVSFLQNHDQIGNRAFGERLISLCDPQDLKILIALVLLAPSPPLLFMGEEFGDDTPFCFFCDFGPELARSVTEGRRKEFAKFPQFSSPASRERIPDPNDEATFLLSKLNWQLIHKKEHQNFLKFYRELLALRQREVVPRLSRIQGGGAGYRLMSARSLFVWWKLEDGSRLTMILNLHDRQVEIDLSPPGRLLYQITPDGHRSWSWGNFPPKSLIWYFETSEDRHV